MIRFFILFLLISVCFIPVTNAQSDEWQSVQKEIEKHGLEIAPPLENQFEFIKTDNDLVDSDFAITKKKDDLEIRFIIQPEEKVHYPHISVTSFLSTLATNDQETVISLLPIQDDVLEIDYKADWGIQAFFKPKDSFSDKEHCKLVAIYKEGKSMTYMAFLFDDVEIDLSPYELILGFD